MFAFLDAAAERRATEFDGELDRITVGVNTGYLISHDREALRKWRSRHRRTVAPRDPQQFTSTVARLAAKFPDAVKTH